MKRFFLLLMINVLCLQAGEAQSLYTERLFLAPEKESCVPGDTLWVEGQLRAADSSFAPLSCYVYLECIDARDSLLVRQKVACDSTGYFCTELPTQFEWEPGVYYLRGYTRWMHPFHRINQADGYALRCLRDAFRRHPYRDDVRDARIEGGKGADDLSLRPLDQQTTSEALSLCAAAAGPVPVAMGCHYARQTNLFRGRRI